MVSCLMALRVCHASSGNLYGGVERLLTVLGRNNGLVPEMDPSFALSFRGALSAELESFGARVHMTGPVRFRHPWTVLAAQRAFAKVLRREGADVVVTHNYWPHLLFGPVARRARVGLVFFGHEVPGNGHWLERLGSWVRPDLVLANSRLSTSRMHLVFRDVPIETYGGPVAPPIASRARAEVRREFGADDAAVVIVLAARLERWKGHATLLRALARMRDVPAWEAWITTPVQSPAQAGYVEELRALAGSGGIAARVRFLGDQPDVGSLMRAADVLCQPNETPEPWGRVFVEALACGLPVVATAIGGALEIVDASCGVLVPPSDPERLAGALRELIADRSKREALGRQGPARAYAVADPRVSMRQLHTFLERVRESARARGAGAARRAS
jgi:glycosyltransferase involved in cell wall biosynthesis